MAMRTRVPGHAASGRAACPHVGTARGVRAPEGRASSRAETGEPSLRRRHGKVERFILRRTTLEAAHRLHPPIDMPSLKTK